MDSSSEHLPASLPAEGALPVAHAVRFTALGPEYFRIWIVNVALSFITLGVYSAWAKVRRMNYFYRHTFLAGSSFEYHAQPIRESRRAAWLAVFLLILWNVAPEIHPVFFAVVVVAGLCVVPWLIATAFKFRLHNSGYRGLRFRFLGRNQEAAKVFLLYPFLAVVTLGIAYPYFKWRAKRFFFDHAAFGSAQAKFNAPVGPFYRAYVFAAFLTILIPSAIALYLIVLLRNSFGEGSVSDPREIAGRANVLFIAPALTIGFIVYLSIWAYVRARIHVVCWDGLAIAEHRVRCQLSASKYAGTAALNLLAIFITFGLYKPFSDVRLTGLLAESIQLHCVGDLSNAFARVAAETRAAGEEAADLFDMDIGL